MDSEPLSFLARNHRRINNWLTAAVVVLGFYIAITPWLPNISLWIDKWLDDSSGYVYRGDLSSGQTADDSLIDPPKDNRLVIPSINLDEPVLEGADLSVIGAGGTWRRPNTSSPEKGGNTVIVAHRFSYSSPATFYHLDKLKTGERFAVWWQETEYVYEIFETSVVGANQLSIEEASFEPIVTLYTCTPIWTASNRLVIKGRLVPAEEV